MGDQVTDTVEGTLYYAPVSEFERAQRLNIERGARTKLVATLARLNALYMIGRAGSGHIGSSFSSLDIVTWLHLDRMGPKDLYFSSKGHDVPGLYALLIGLGKLPQSGLQTLRRLGGLPGHPEIDTPGIVANTGSLGMGISKAKGLVRAHRAKGETREIFVLTGDGELQEGQIWESLATAVRDGLHEISVIVDHNKLQSDTFVQRVSTLGDLEAKFRAFGWPVGRVDGHDPNALARVLDTLKAEAPKLPRVVIADTIKGAGVSFMQPDAMGKDEEFYRYHSGAPSPSDYRRAAAELIANANAVLASVGAAALTVETDEKKPAPPLPSTVQRLVPAYTEALLAAADRQPELFALDADLILDTGLIPFRDRHPARFVECGIAEQDMVSQACGMARGGLLPVVHSFAAFLTQRASEQIYNAASERHRILYVGTLAGLVPAGPGHSHQGIRDIAAMASIPGMTVVEPSCAAEVKPLLDWCLTEAEGPSYMRLLSVPCDVPYAWPAGSRAEPGKGVVLRDGKDVVAIAYGPLLLSELYRAAELLERRKVSVKVVALPWLSHVDLPWLRATVGSARTLITLDNHIVQGGQGALLAQAALRLDRANLSVHSFALEGWPACGTPVEVLAHHRLDAALLSERITAAHRAE